MPPVQYRITSICFAWLLNYPNRLTDATEKVLILHKTVQGKAYLYVLHYYILYVKTVFQCPRDRVSDWKVWNVEKVICADNSSTDNNTESTENTSSTEENTSENSDETPSTENTDGESGNEE